MSSPLRKLRKKHDESEEWAVSFADMMTLLLCFFILMVSISAVDIERYDEVAESLGLALDPANTTVEHLTPPQKGDAAGGPQAGSSDRFPVTSPTVYASTTLDDVMEELSDRLRVAGGAVSLERKPDSVEIRLRGPVFFQLASADLTRDSLGYLEAIAQELQHTSYDIIVEGHTDDLPISTRQFPSNWELSAARASAVARQLINSRIAPSRVQVRGFAHTRPLVPNRNEKGMALPENQVLNRRVVVIVKAKDNQP